MSLSIANNAPNGSAVARRHDHATRLAASVIAYLAFCLMTITLRPFNARSLTVAEGGGAGDPVNQIGFLIAGTVMTAALLMLVDRRLLRIFLTPTWLGIGVVLIVSIIAAPDPDAALRSVVLTLIGMLLATGVVLLPHSEEAFRGVTASAILTVLALSYGSVVLFPELAVHGDTGFEAQHQGLWRGHFAHKNSAGPIMSVFVMFGLYFWRSGLRTVGGLIAVLALVFVIQTGSKTTNGLLPVAVMVVLVGRAFGLPALTVVLYVMVVALVGALTLGTIYSETWAGFTAAILADPTFTGRVTLWEYGLQNISEQFWFGTGFDSFWATPRVTGIEYPYEWAWDFRGIVHGHNNFIDMALTMGIVGFAVLFWVLFVLPVVNYVRACRTPENRPLADLFMMILVFMTMLSFLETFFLRRNEPTWLIMFLAINGLMLAARFRTSRPQSGQDQIATSFSQ